MKVKEPQHHIDQSLLMDTGRPENGGWNEQGGATTEQAVAEILPEKSEQGNAAPEYQEGEEQGIDIKIIEREKVKDHVDELQHIIRQVGNRIVGNEAVKIREQVMLADETAPEEIPDIPVIGKITPGDEIVQTSRACLQSEKKEQHGGPDPAASEERHPCDHITADNAVKHEQENVHRLLKQPDQA